VKYRTISDDQFSFVDANLDRIYVASRNLVAAGVGAQRGRG
jgi:hypothetical protein